MALGRSGFAATLCAVLLPQCANALSASAGQGEPQNGLASGQVYNPAFALVPGFAPAIDNLWLANPPLAGAVYRSVAATGSFGDDLASPAFDIGSYDAMWDDTWFSEIAAYGGLRRDLERVANMRAMGGSDSTGIPYGRLTLQREFLDGQQHLSLGAYGLHVNVRPTAISGFGDDGYTDVAVDSTWRWTAHPERSVSDSIAAHVLVLHEGESLIASHAIFGTATKDELTVLRGDVSYSWGAPVTPAIEFFQITGTSDPVRLGTLDGSPDSKGWIAQMDYAPKADSPLARLNVHLALQFIAYSEFDGATSNASHNNTILLHLTVGGDAG